MYNVNRYKYKLIKDFGFYLFYYHNLQTAAQIKVNSGMQCKSALLG